MKEYWQNIKTTTKTLSEGLKVTFKHIKDARGSREALYTDDDNYFERQNGIFTTQYPKEVLPVPHHGRYKLHNEIDDCIVCDKCAKVCPVNCIDIEPVRSVGEFGKTSDGTSKRIYAAKFDIDMAKCCFCGLCTVVCPTECLTMTDEYDFSTDNIADHNFEFGEMTPLEILEKRKELEEFNKQKEAAKAAKITSAGAAKPQMKPRVAPGSAASTAGSAKPVFRPKVPVKRASTDAESGAAKPKPVMRPKVVVKKKEAAAESQEASSNPRPVIKPKVPMKPKVPASRNEGEESSEGQRPKAVRPKIPIKPKVPTPEKPEEKEDTGAQKPKAVRPKVPMRPKIPTPKPDNPDPDSNESAE